MAKILKRCVEEGPRISCFRSLAKKKDFCIGKHYIGADNVVPNFPFFGGGGKMYWLFNLKWKRLFFYPLAFCRVGGGLTHTGCFA